MLLPDTATVAEPDRDTAFRAAFDQASVPCRIQHLGPDRQVHARMQLWQFGPASLFTTDASGFSLLRTPRHLRREGPAVVALAVQAHGVGRFSQFDTDTAVLPGQLMLSDLTAPYAFSWRGTGGSRAFQIPYEQLALPPDAVRVAAARRGPGPPAAAGGECRRPGRRRGVVRAGDSHDRTGPSLLVSAAGDGRLARREGMQWLLDRALTYARAHLGEPDLGPERIAAAHHVSLRQLYKACEQGGVSLEQWLIAERLEIARAVLTSPMGRHRPIASVALSCGFADPSHFARRFRAAYGVAPRDWLRATAQR